VEGGGDEDDARGGAAEEVGDGGLDGVEGAEDVDVDDALEGVGAQAVDGGDEVSCCAGAVYQGKRKTPKLDKLEDNRVRERGLIYMTKSMPPSSLAHLSAAAFRASGYRETR
jgi:hypothetical protein